VLAETGFQLGEFKTLKAILAQDHPWIVKFLVIVTNSVNKWHWDAEWVRPVLLVVL